MMRPLGYAVATVVDPEGPTTTPPPPTTTMTWAEAHHAMGLGAVLVLSGGESVMTAAIWRPADECHERHRVPRSRRPFWQLSADARRRSGSS